MQTYKELKNIIAYIAVFEAKYMLLHLIASLSIPVPLKQLLSKNSPRIQNN